ncbi:MAG: HAD family phosphatase [Acidimicrobiia bacterium]|nr:HAD family phosphatase [Acidimicrobiia bacterium]
MLPSPFEAFAAYERAHGLPDRFISGVVVNGGDDGAWSRHERGEIDFEVFCSAFADECSEAGGTVVVSDLMDSLMTGVVPRPAYLKAIALIRSAGLSTAALTNNWAGPPVSGADPTDPTAVALDALADTFDVVIESAVVGLRKPDLAIYELTCTELGVSPPEAVFLDDIGANLKPARALGMHTIKVTDPDAALTELSGVLGFPLR